MPDFNSLDERYKFIDNLYSQHSTLVASVQADALKLFTGPDYLDILSLPAIPTPSSSFYLERINAFLSDQITLFRFLRKAKFDPDVCIHQLLKRTLHWRLTTGLDNVSLSSLDPLYSDCQNGLFYLHPKMRDRWGRMTGVVNLVNVRRPEDGSLESLKEFIAFQLEVIRRYLAYLSVATDKSHIQIVLIMNLSSSSLSNFDLEMMPYTIDLLKNHFPGMVGAVFTLGYGWGYAGMWQVAKRVLPKVALDRILFPSNEEILQYFEPKNLLKDFGGNLSYTYHLSTNYVLAKYGRPAHYLRPFRLPSTSTPLASGAVTPSSPRAISRIPSLEHLPEQGNENASKDIDEDGDSTDIFYSTPGTPRHFSSTTVKSNSIRSIDSHTHVATVGGTDGHGQNRTIRNHSRKPSWLDMTPAATTGNPASYRPDSPLASASRTSVYPSREDNFMHGIGIPLPRVGSLPPGGFREALQAPEVGQSDYDYFIYEQEEEDHNRVRGEQDSELEHWDKDPLSSEKRQIQYIAASAVSALRSVSRAQAVSQLRSQLNRSHATSQPFQPTISPEANRHDTLPYVRSGHVSPLNPLNPHYGYPARASSHGTIHLSHHRRRKRDLARTLTYLLALRIIGVHREMKWRLEVVLRLLWGKLVEMGAVSRRWARARWAGAISSSSNAREPNEQNRNGEESEEEDEETYYSSMDEGGQMIRFGHDISSRSSQRSLVNLNIQNSNNNSRTRSVQKRKKAVHWNHEASLPISIEERPSTILHSLVRSVSVYLHYPLVIFRLIPRWMIYLSAILLFRSKWFRKRARRLVVYVKAELLARMPTKVRERLLVLARKRED